MTKEEKAANDLKNLFFNQLDQIYNTCESAAKDFDATSIPLNFLNECIKASKKGFNKGFSKK